LWQLWRSVPIASLITVYFFRKNLIGTDEASVKAMMIMIITTVMAVIMLTWCGVTLIMRDPGQVNAVPMVPDLHPKLNPASGEVEDPTGFLKHTGLGAYLRELTGISWFSMLGVVGLFLAFG